VITRSEGDCLARYLCRIDEMKESISMIRQLLDKLPAGPIHAEDAKLYFPARMKFTRRWRVDRRLHADQLRHQPPPRLVLRRGFAKGELGFYIVSNGAGIRTFENPRPIVQ